MTVLLDPQYSWRTAQAANATIHFIGEQRIEADISASCRDSAVPDTETINACVSKARGFFAGIIETNAYVMAFVDRYRSYPLFWAKTANGFIISNSARRIRDKLGLSDIDTVSAQEFAMAGYVTGPETLYAEIKQLQAGELLVASKADGKVETRRYYQFFTPHRRIAAETGLVDELAAATDEAIDRLIERANGRPIWLGLSGGLDSRLLACKLAERKYRPFHTFTYGPSGNHEAKVAEHVAATLDIPWRFVPATRDDARKLFHSEIRKQYWNFADGLASLPFPFEELLALLKLRDTGALPDDALIVNGQTGDFISGDHIPSALIIDQPGPDEFFESIIGKHYGFWPELLTERSRSDLEMRICQALGIDRSDLHGHKNLVGLYEYWEWQERQCKYVINGQRIYDFLNLAWHLPLWDDAYLRFWVDIPVAQKIGQRLYRTYLDRYDYKGLFRDFNPYVWRWPGATMAVVPLARAAGLFLGPRAKDHVYRLARYYGHYRNLYAPIPFADFRQHAGHIRGALSLHAAIWFNDNGITDQPLNGRLSAA